MEENLPLANNESKASKTKKILLGISGVLVVIPSVINSGADIYRAIMNSPIGSSEVRNIKLMKSHWEEQALFKKDIEIKKDTVTKILKLRVYENADIWVKYGLQEQWLASSDTDTIAVNPISIIGSAIADDNQPPVFHKMSSPVLFEELKPVTVDLNKIRSEKDRSLSEPAQVIERSYLFAETNDSHRGFNSTTRKYIKTFKAEEGFIINDAKIDIMSINNANTPKIIISEDKKTLTLEVELKSGPIYDRWRGWIKAGIITNQQTEE